jgi:Pyridoxamine 5'-phosphate oxidase
MCPGQHHAGAAEGRNLLANPRVSLLVVDPDNTARFIQVGGDAELVNKGALEHLDALTPSYTRHRRYYGYVYLPGRAASARDAGHLPDPLPADHPGHDPRLSRTQPGDQQQAAQRADRPGDRHGRERIGPGARRAPTGQPVGATDEEGNERWPATSCRRATAALVDIPALRGGDRAFYDGGGPGRAVEGAVHGTWSTRSGARRHRAG